MEISLRRVVLADAPALAALSRQTFYDTFTGTCTEADMQQFLADYYNVDQVESELRNEADFYFFAEIDGVQVGYIRFMEDYSNFDTMQQWKALELKRLYVLNAFHGKGVAQKLMDYFLNFAQQHQYEVVWLGVWEHNLKAQHFYAKYGFEFSGHTHDFPIGNTPQTDQWFWRFLVAQ